MQEAHWPHASVTSIFFFGDGSSPNKPSEFSFTEVHTMYCANASASGNAPFPSLPKKSNAWLRRLLCTISNSLCLVFSWPMTSLKSIYQKLKRFSSNECITQRVQRKINQNKY